MAKKKDKTGLFEFVTVGDPHLDKMENLFPANHLQLQVAELRKPFLYALERGVPNVVILGDVAHKDRLTEESRIALFSLLVEFDGKLDIHIILGNHDVAYEGFHSLQFFVELYEAGKFKTVHIYKKPVQKTINGVPVNFLPFPAIKAIESDVADRTLNFAHLERPGALRDNGIKIQKGHGIRQKDDHTWVVGHLHTPQRLGRTYFSGTLYQTNFGESLPKSFLHGRVRVKNGKLLEKIVQVPNDPAFKLFNLRIEKRSDLDAIQDNPLYLYKLFIKKGVKIDFDLSTRYKNLYNTPSTYTNEAELLEQQQEVAMVIENDLTGGLLDELREKGASKWQRKRGTAIVNEILEELKAKAA